MPSVMDGSASERLPIAALLWADVTGSNWVEYQVIQANATNAFVKMMSHVDISLDWLWHIHRALSLSYRTVSSDGA